MGRLRLCCCAVILLSCAGIFQLYKSDISALAMIVLAIGILPLAAITPLAASDRRARRRVVGACMAYTVAAALTAIMAMNESGAFNPLLTALPAMGALLSLWAYLTRNRRRVSSYDHYFND
ncbi:MAG: hypothetical protein OSA39_15655 [Sphingobium sp.]|nr:hypothetical protein [Sphingobium sp.]